MSDNPAADAVLGLVKTQHDILEKMLKNVADAGEAQRKAAVGTLERFLSAHEAAEEAYLEQATKNLENMQGWVEKLTELDFTSSDFVNQFGEFQKELLNHTQTEINHTIPKALKDMTQAQLDLVQAAFERVSQTAESVDE
ncbi:hypothetical protein [Granulicoccus sp. GXG6511]|uniref:hypothetical protein n=1 Tax=Granulicoccus sp. GXG6511 TaxID=3381351 RepID=UPI003D7EAFB5